MEPRLTAEQYAEALEWAKRVAQDTPLKVHRLASALLDAHEQKMQLAPLRTALRDVCMGHADDCDCIGCHTAFAREEK